MTTPDDGLTMEPSEFYVTVGDRPVKVTESEWIVATAEKGDRLRVTPTKPGGLFNNQPHRTFEVVFQSSYFYDGVTGRGYEPDPDDLIERTIWPWDLVERVDG